jgi:hypothetical protein
MDISIIIRTWVKWIRPLLFFPAVNTTYFYRIIRYGLANSSLPLQAIYAEPSTLSIISYYITPTPCRPHYNQIQFQNAVF